jgi:hypothetical protein|nr:hypothetical protein Q903MT_gene1777 [Picea sitchensis]
MFWDNGCFLYQRAVTQWTLLHLMAALISLVAALYNAAWIHITLAIGIPMQVRVQFPSI